MDEIIKLPTAEEFYNQKDSAYLRIEFRGVNGFRITLRNEALIAKDLDLEQANFVGSLARGLLEVCYANAEQVYHAGMRANFLDVLEASADNLTDKQKAIWMMPSEGSLH